MIKTIIQAVQNWWLGKHLNTAVGNRPILAKPQPNRWTRPVGNDWVDLTQEQCVHVQTTGTCPYCGANLFGGPSGGASQNLFCGNLECDTRLNVSEMIPWGQFTGGIPSDFRAFLEAQAKDSLT